MRSAVACQNCGAKVRGDRNRCPRCRARLVVPDAARVGGSRAARWLAPRQSSSACLRSACGAVVQEGIRSGTRRRWTGCRSAVRPAQRRADRRGTDRQCCRCRRSDRFSNPRARRAVAYEAGDYNAALAKYLAAIEKNPDDAESLSNLGQVLIRLNRTPESIPYFERAVSILPGRWAYQFNLARAQGLLGHMDEAVAGYRRAQSLFPDDYATTFNLAMTLHQQGRRCGGGRRVPESDCAPAGGCLVPQGPRDQLRATEAGAASGSGLRGVSAAVAVGRGCR